MGYHRRKRYDTFCALCKTTNTQRTTKAGGGLEEAEISALVRLGTNRLIARCANSLGYIREKRTYKLCDARYACVQFVGLRLGKNT